MGWKYDAMGCCEGGLIEGSGMDGWMDAYVHNLSRLLGGLVGSGYRVWSTYHIMVHGEGLARVNTCWFIEV